MTSYDDALRDARSELVRLQVLHAEIEARIAQIERTIAGLATLTGEEEANTQGLTETIRSILKATPRDLTPTEVRDQLKQIGFDLARYVNPLAAIHTTLKRLAEKGQATIVLRSNDVAYRWYRWMLNDPAAPEALNEAGERGADLIAFWDEFLKRRA